MEQQVRVSESRSRQNFIRGFFSFLAEMGLQGAAAQQTLRIFFLCAVIIKNCFTLFLTIITYPAIWFEGIRLRLISNTTQFALTTLSILGIVLLFATIAFRRGLGRGRGSHPMLRILSRVDLSVSQILPSAALLAICHQTSDLISGDSSWTSILCMMANLFFFVMASVVNFANQSILCRNSGFFGTEFFEYFMMESLSTLSLGLGFVFNGYAWLIVLEGMLMVVMLTRLEKGGVYFDARIISAESLFHLLKLAAISQVLLSKPEQGGLSWIGLMVTIWGYIMFWVASLRSTGGTGSPELMRGGLREAAKAALSDAARASGVVSARAAQRRLAFSFQKGEAKCPPPRLNSADAFERFVKLAEWRRRALPEEPLPPLENLALRSIFRVTGFGHKVLPAASNVAEFGRGASNLSGISERFQRLKDRKRMAIEEPPELGEDPLARRLQLIDAVTASFTFWFFLGVNCSPRQFFKVGRVALAQLERLDRLCKRLKNPADGATAQALEIRGILRGSADLDANIDAFLAYNADPPAQADGDEQTKFHWQQTAVIEFAALGGEATIVRASLAACALLGFRTQMLATFGSTTVIPSFYGVWQEITQIKDGEMWLILKSGYLQKFVVHLARINENEGAEPAADCVACGGKGVTINIGGMTSSANLAGSALSNKADQLTSQIICTVCGGSEKRYSLTITPAKHFIRRCSFVIDVQGKILGMTASALSVAGASLASAKILESINHVLPDFWRSDPERRRIGTFFIQCGAERGTENQLHYSRLPIFQASKINVVELHGGAFEINVFPVTPDSLFPKWLNPLFSARKNSLPYPPAPSRPSLPGAVVLSDSDSDVRSEVSSDSEDTLLGRSFNDSELNSGVVPEKVPSERRNTFTRVSRRLSHRGASALPVPDFQTSVLNSPEPPTDPSVDSQSPASMWPPKPYRFSVAAVVRPSKNEVRDISREDPPDIEVRFLQRGQLLFSRATLNESGEADELDLPGGAKDPSNSGIPAPAGSNNPDSHSRPNRTEKLCSMVSDGCFGIISVGLVATMVFALALLMQSTTFMNNRIIDFIQFTFNQKNFFYNLQTVLVYIDSQMLSQITGHSIMSNADYTSLMKVSTQNAQFASSDFIRYGRLTEAPPIVDEYFARISLYITTDETQSFTIDTLMSYVSKSLSQASDLRAQDISFRNVNVFFLVFNYLRRFYNLTFDASVADCVDKVFEVQLRDQIYLGIFMLAAGLLAIQMIFYMKWCERTLQKQVEKLKKIDHEMVKKASIALLRSCQVTLGFTQDWMNSIISNTNANRLASKNANQSIVIFSQKSMILIFAPIFISVAACGLFFSRTSENHSMLRKTHTYNRELIMMNGMYPHLVARVVSVLLDDKSEFQTMTDYKSGLIPLFDSMATFYATISSLTFDFSFEAPSDIASPETPCDFVLTHDDMFQDLPNPCKTDGAKAPYYSDTIEIALQRVLETMNFSFKTLLGRNSTDPSSHFDNKKLAIEVTASLEFVTAFVIPYQRYQITKLKNTNASLFNRVGYESLLFFGVALASSFFVLFLSVLQTYLLLRKSTRTSKKIHQLVGKKVADLETKLLKNL